MSEERDATSTHRLGPDDQVATQTSVVEGAEKKTWLLIVAGENAQLASIARGQRVVLGREAPADIAIADRSLSRRHVSLESANEGVWVEDLGSTNGTNINGRLVVGKTLFSPGDELSMGNVTAYLQEITPSPKAPDRLFSHDRFQTSLEEEVERARSFGRKLALVFAGFAAPATAPAGASPVARARALLRPFDRMALYSERAIEILLPEMGAGQAQPWAKSLIDALGGAGTEPVLGIAIYPDSATSPEALILAARRALRDASPNRPISIAAALGTRTLSESASDEDAEKLESGGAVFASPTMQAVLLTTQRIARSSIPVLVHGETGTGKELIARMIHDRGPRRTKPLCAVNCAAIPASLLESILFGHEQGAFTGASKAQKGMFESADGGTVFLDEIGELPPQAQAALLRVLETKRISRIGSHQEIAVDVRIVAATHRNLEAMCKEGRFREDLYYRLNAMTIEIPPLRGRPEDIIPLARHFLERANRDNGTAIHAIEPEALRALCAYAWPGNVRELRNAIERAVVIAAESEISILDLPERIRAQPEEKIEASGSRAAISEDAPDTTPSPPAIRDDGDAGDFKTMMQKLEARVLVQALEKCGGNQTEAARSLQMPRRTFVEKIRMHGIKRKGYEPSE